ncbi:MAG: transglycosylase domain-containing protein [Bacteroidia bacterium]|nr:transglycosylase domain-containing protein [Bacteroidia bacterium]
MKLKKTSIYKLSAVLIILISGLGYFWLRPMIAKTLLEKKIIALEEKQHCKISFKEISVEGLQKLNLQNLQITANQDNWRLTVDSLSLEWSFFSLFKTIPEVTALRIGNLNYTEIKTQLHNNKQDTAEKNTVNWKQRLLRIPSSLSKIVALTPAYIQLHSGNFLFTDSIHQLNIKLIDFQPKEKYFTGIIQLKQDSLPPQQLNCHLTIDKQQHKILGQLKSKQEVFLPTGYFLPSLPLIYFDSLGFDIHLLSKSQDEATLSLKMNSYKFKIWHDKLSKEDISCENIQAYIPLHFDKESFSVDSSCFVQLNNIRFQNYFQVWLDPDWRIQASIKMNGTPAEQFFASLPAGMFQSFEGIQTKGQLSFYANLEIDFQQLDSLHFDAGLIGKPFAYIAPGKVDFSKVNGDFVYYPIHGSKPIRLGSGSADYVPLSNISPLLRESVQQAEDGRFYWHHGFNMEAINKAITVNIKEKRFVRGASTLTMQFVKNVFLKHEKRLARKLEEMLIVWLIENEHLVSKDRILELYLNLIEWGPDIYGAKAASAFYFAKKPADLTLSEALFLAMIIPRPLGFRYHFNPQTGQLEEFNTLFYKVVAGHLLANKVISQTDYDSLKVAVTLKSPAKTYLRSNLEAPEDSLSNQDISPFGD